MPIIYIRWERTTWFRYNLILYLFKLISYYHFHARSVLYAHFVFCANAFIHRFKLKQRVPNWLVELQFTGFTAVALILLEFAEGEYERIINGQTITIRIKW